MYKYLRDRFLNFCETYGSSISNWAWHNEITREEPSWFGIYPVDEWTHYDNYKG